MLPPKVYLQCIDEHWVMPAELPGFSFTIPLASMHGRVDVSSVRVCMYVCMYGVYVYMYVCVDFLSQFSWPRCTDVWM